MKKKHLIILLLILSFFLFGCNKRDHDKVDIKDPSIEYKSFYDGSYGTSGTLEGNTLIISIFTDDANTKWTNSKSDKKIMTTSLNKLSEAVKFLKKSAKEYGKKLTFVYDWEEYKDLKYFASFEQDLVTPTGEYYDIQKAWINQNINIKALKNKYQADNIVFLYFLNTEFKNSVKPWTINHSNCPYCDIEYSNIYWCFEGIATPASTLAHEILHQFGAPDLYIASNVIPQKYVDYLTANNSKDIMFYITKGSKVESKFTALDAYYVGIGSRPKEADQWLLGLSEFDKG